MEALLIDENSSLAVDGLLSSIIHRGADVDSEKACPACAPIRLRQVQVGRVELDLCPSCGGVFFDEGEIEQVLPTTHKPHGSGVGTALAAEGIFWSLIMFLMGS